MKDITHSAESAKPKRVRSPGYPALALNDAIDRGRQLYEANHHHFAPIEAISQTWGYAGGGNTASLYMAALRRYGLVDELDAPESQSRQFKISDFARKIILSPPDVRMPLLKEAALKPKIFSELWSHFKSEIPGDELLRMHLIMDRGFNKDAVPNFIRIFRTTLKFANLVPGDRVQGSDGPEEMDQEDELPSASTAASVSTGAQITPALTKMPEVSEQREFVLPIPNGGILIRGPFPLSESDFETFKKAIELFKPWLAKSDRAAQ